ncbi:MAG: molybdopterin cofactor-binding domain-containing protein [Caldilineaceae bacterium]
MSHPPSDRTASLGELAQDRSILRIATDDAPVTPPSAWKTAGQSAAKIGGQAFVTAQHRYASDQALPNMLYGKILRPPAYRATLASIDTSAAEAMTGVTVVRDGDFVGVTAPDEQSASQALEAIRVRWKTEMQVSQPELFDYLKANPLPPVEGDRRRMPYLAIEGAVEEGLAAAHLTLSQAYTVDYIAHAPLEPRAALAEWQGDRLLVWTGTSRPFGVRTELAMAFAMPESQIRVIVPDTGSGYGGKHTGQAAIEAARLAKAMGKPVKVVWTRQEEFIWAYLRPAGLIEIKGGVDSEGRFTALELHNYNSGSAGIEALYVIPNRHIHYQPCDSPLPQGSYRSLAAPANHFARESFVDELAHQLGIDPLEMRLRNLKDERMIAVLTAAADAFGWGKTTPAPNHGIGIAGGFDKNSYVATCAEVAIDPTDQQIRVVRVVAAYDCGALINPNNVRNQVEGAIVQGIGGALFESIQFANGRILNPDFANYRVPRFGDMPIIETILLDRKDIPSAGAGETPIVAIAPAIGNAIFHATGMRVRSMPMRLG